MNHPVFILKIGVLCAFMILMGAMAKRQFDRAWAMEADNTKLEQKLRGIKIDNQDLKKQAAALDKDPGKHRAAQHLGYLDEGQYYLQIAPAKGSSGR